MDRALGLADTRRSSHTLVRIPMGMERMADMEQWAREIDQIFSTWKRGMRVMRQCRVG